MKISFYSFTVFWVNWNHDCLSLLGLDKGLYVSNVFWEFNNWKHLKLFLIQKLEITLCIPYRGEKLLIVHLVLLNGWYDVFFVVVQNVALEFWLVGWEGNTVVSIVEMGWQKTIKILYMHEPRVDFIDHGFPEVLLQHSFVLFSQTS